MLNTIVDGNYGKRMNIPGKDLHQNGQAVAQLKNDLLIQSIAKQELKKLEKLNAKDDECEILSQIKDSLE